jgi:hypothetical protein
VRSPARAAIAWLAAALACSASTGNAADAVEDPMVAGFVAPPRDAHPLVFWQWVNGNVTHDGIRLDLEWMSRIGIAGAILFDIGFSRPPVPQFVEERVGFASLAWQKAVQFAAAESRRLGLLLGAQSSGGWSVSGGPMVTPARAMKKLVWSETPLTAESPATLRLPVPPGNNGPYQDAAIDNTNYLEPTQAADVAVIAFRLPEAEQVATPRATYDGVSRGEWLDDGSFARGVELHGDAKGQAAIDVRLEFAPRSVTLGKPGRGALPAGVIEASSDGARYDPVIKLPGTAAQPSLATTFALGERTERHWRIRFTGLQAPVVLTELRFESGARIHRAPEKAGYGVLRDYFAEATAPVPPARAVNPSTIIDVSAHLQADGTLSWRPPAAGRWMALRFGWSLTGRRTVPANSESIGLEVDKLDAHAVREFAEAFFGLYRRAIGDAGRLDIAFTDSWEAGQQNWTPTLLDEFAARRGYDLRHWLPVLTGRVVGDTMRSEQVLSDFRRTLGDLLVANHYGELARTAGRHGMQFYSEAAGTDLPTLIDGLAAKSQLDVPTGEYWFWPENKQPKDEHVADVREAASAAHVYARRMVAAESFTSMGEEAWALGPAQLRRMADRFFAEGVNRVILHTSAHQPFTDRRPGMTLRQYGQHFTRNETWAEDAGDWIRYLSRCSYLLQQGRPVADLAVYLGEDAPAALPFERPTGFDYDFINAEVLLTRMEMRAGRLTLPDGVSYRALLLPPRIRRMSPAVLRKLRSLAAQGAIVIRGPKPQGTLGLGDPSEASRLIDELWGPGKVAPARIGKGRLHFSLDQAVEDGDLMPDAIVHGGGVHWTHRATDDADIYFVSNQRPERFDGSVDFRVVGRGLEAWNAVDGTRTPVSHARVGQYTRVQVRLRPWESRFLVFRGSAPAVTAQVDEPARDLLLALTSDWEVEFLDGQGAPARIRLNAGESWTANADPAIRFYSGRARYTRHVEVPTAWLSDHRRIELDLGRVGDLARVRINGKNLGVWWGEPFSHDVTDALREGDNQVEITVTNYWANRFIGDEQPGATRVTFAPIRPYQADSPLRPSGLLGPVELIAVTPRSLP